MLVGLVGTVLPALPGVPLIFVGVLLAAWIDDFQRIGGWTVTAIGVLAALGFVIDYVAAAATARRAGASASGIIGAALGTIAGVFTGLWGLIFMVGNKDLVAALGRIKSYHDYGTFTPIQVASIAALEGPQDCVEEIRREYQRRRDVLVRGLHEAGWMVDVPKASMYIWATIPEPYRALGSLEFAKKVLAEAKVAVSPGIGFGDYGDSHVRFALIENEHRIKQAIRGVKEMFRKDALLPLAAA